MKKRNNKKKFFFRCFLSLFHCYQLHQMDANGNNTLDPSSSSATFSGNVVNGQEALLGTTNVAPVWLISGGNKRIKLNNEEPVTVIDQGAAGIGLTATKVTLSGGDPTAALEAAPKQYVDSKVGGITYDQSLNTTDNVTFNNVSTADISLTGLSAEMVVNNGFTNALTVKDLAATEYMVVNTQFGNEAVDMKQPLICRGDVDCKANVDVAGSITVTGDVTVNGTTTTIDTANLTVQDNVILLNNGEGGAGVANGTGQSGIQIDRGTENDVELVFDDADNDTWKFRNAVTTSALPISAGDASFTSVDTVELKNTNTVNGTAISNAQWGHVGTMDQDVATTSNVTFNKATISDCMRVVCNDGSGPTGSDTLALRGVTVQNNPGISIGYGTARSIFIYGQDAGSNDQNLIIKCGTKQDDTANPKDLPTRISIDHSTGKVTLPSNDLEVVGDAKATSVDTVELKNTNTVNSTAISNAQWGYLGSTNQGVATTDDVTFNSVTFNKPLGELYWNGSTTSMSFVNATHGTNWYEAASASTGGTAGTVTYKYNFALQTTDVSSTAVYPATTSIYELKYTGTPTKLYHCGCSFTFISGGTNIDWEFALGKNGVEQDSSKVHITADTKDRQYSSALHGYVELATNDRLCLMVRRGVNITTDENIIIEDFNLFAVAFPNTTYT